MIQQCSSVKHGEKSPMLDEISAKFVGELAIHQHSSPWFSCFFFPRTNILVFFTKKIRDARDGFLGFFQVQPIVFSKVSQPRLFAAGFRHLWQGLTRRPSRVERN
jgi:hypothetical protein